MILKLLLLLSSLLFLLTGCRNASELLHKVIIPKNHNYTMSNQALNQCNIAKAMTISDKNENNFLKNSELGLGAYFRYAHSASNKYFDNAINIYRQNENKALFDISTFLRKEYQEEGYDKVFLHNYKAINYLMMGEVEAARVESKNANLLQEEERKKLHKFKAENKNNKTTPFLSRYEKLFNQVNPTHMPYQNPFAYYISALTYAEDEDYDNALVDIRQALTFFPNAMILKNKLIAYEKQEKEHSVELFFDIGEAPLKAEKKLELIMGKGEKRMAYLPSYSLKKSLIDHIKIINSKGIEVSRTSLLVDINAIKINEFKEKLSTILYLITKEASLSTLANELTDNPLAPLLKIGTTIYGQKKIGTWSFLPQKILVSSFKPQKDETYSMLIMSQKNEVIEQKYLELKHSNKTKNIYKHFTIRKNNICY